MAQNITLMGANYEDVPSVTLPRTGGGTASFVDIGDTTASASDVLEGKVMYTASGIRTIGTGAIGGGVPSGGITNEVLTKVSSTDYDVTWSSIPVQSVNNKTGVIILTASDVGALPSTTTIPTKTSDLVNNSGFITTEIDPTVPSWAKASNKPEYDANEVGAIAVPTAASSGQLLGYDGSEWTAMTVDFNSLPSGGSTGQVLAKSSNDDYAVAWTTVQSGETLPIIKKNIINNGTYTFALDHNNIYSGQNTIEDDEFYPNVGDVINIIWDGVKYTCVVKDESYGYPYIGSYSINSGTPGDYPFFIAWIQPMNYRQFFTLDTASSHTISAFSIFEDNTPLAIKNQEWKPSYRTLLPQTNRFSNILTDDAVTLEEFESGVYYTQIYSYQFYQPNDGDTIHILAKESDYKILDVDETLHEVSRLSYYAGELDQENYYSYRIVLEPETFGNGISITFYSYDPSITYLSISIGTPNNMIMATYNGKWVQTTLADIGSGLTLPSGGTLGQMLVKASSSDYDVTWADPSGGGGQILPSGGDAGQILVKATASDYDVSWGSIPVQSVNGKTGTINLSASDVGALSSTTAIPSKVSDLNNDLGFVTASGAASAAPVQSVNSKTGAVNLSASDVGALPQNTAIPSCAADVGALPSNTFIPSVASDVGAIPAPASASSDNVLAYNGSAWVADKRMVILSYGHSTWAEFLSAYHANAVIYCRASSNSNPGSGSQTRMAFMAYVNNADNPTNVEFQYYRSVNQHSITQQGDQMYVYKLDKTAGWTVTVRESYTKINVGTGLASSYSNSALTITNPAAVPTGGTTGQALVKTSSTNYALAWQTIDATLPVVTTSDNGKVLRVVNGAWAAAQLSSANGVIF